MSHGVRAVPYSTLKPSDRCFGYAVFIGNYTHGPHYGGPLTTSGSLILIFQSLVRGFYPILFLLLYRLEEQSTRAVYSAVFPAVSGVPGVHHEMLDAHVKTCVCIHRMRRVPSLRETPRIREDERGKIMPLSVIRDPTAIISVQGGR